MMMSSADIMMMSSADITMMSSADIIKHVLKKLTYLNMHTCHLPPNLLHEFILRQPAMKKPSRGSK
jgi:hypothetical protein